MVAPDLLERREAVGARHAQVEQDDVRVRPADQRQHLAAGLSLRHDLEVGLLFE